jgi:uncharacterized protein
MIDAPCISHILSCTDAHPFYTQYLCHLLWELCDEQTGVGLDDVQRAVDVLLRREQYAYSLLWETLTRNQQRFLRGLAEPAGPAKPFSSAFLQQHELGSASNAQRAAAALVERDVIEPENGSFIIPDRLLSLWIRRIRQ